MKEQRRAPRFQHDLLVELHERRGARRLHAIDVARHGLFLATDDPPRERHLVQLTVHLPGGPIRAAGSVTRTLRGRTDHEDGVGIQFFALSDEAKERWDDFIFELQRTTPAKGTPLPSPESLMRAPSQESAGGGATFLIKLKSVDRLKDFASTHLTAGGTVLFTPVLRAPGETVTLVVVHPTSDEEFRLPGVIHKAHGDRPKRLEIHFHGVSPALLNAFAAFVESGHPPKIQLETPKLAQPAPPPPSMMEEDFDVDVFDEETLDTDDRILRAPGEVTAPPKPIEQAPVLKADPGLKPDAFLIRCDSCSADPYAVDLGPCRGVLGLVADHRAFVGDGGKVVTTPRLVDGETRQQRTKTFLDGGGRLDATIDVMSMLGAVALADDPKGLKHTRAVERLEHAALKLAESGTPAKTRVSCPSCKDGHLTVERVST